MANVLLVEPDYRSKFPPLGLLRLSTYHRELGDAVTFVRGKIPDVRDAGWHKIYVSSLFTYELPRTVETIRYYLKSVPSPRDVIVGGIGATLMPQYIRDHVDCTVVEGPLDVRDKLFRGSPVIASFIPDYSLLRNGQRKYEPDDAYFCRVTLGCIRHCRFCAVPVLEPTYRGLRGWRRQVELVRERYGERQHLVFLDNNLLASEKLDRVIWNVRELGFTPGVRRNKRLRRVDFNQGIDARLITPEVAHLLATIPLFPVRLAFDYDGMEPHYRRAIHRLAEAGFQRFTNYLLFNCHDNPASLYRRLRINLELSEQLKVRITGFPMRYIPIEDVHRRYVAERWHWRYLRGIQCVLLATHGMVSPNTVFFNAAFGSNYEEFLEILSMPDRYIINREEHKNNGALEWRSQFRRLTPEARTEFLDTLERIHRSRQRDREIQRCRRFRKLLEHYYPREMADSQLLLSEDDKGAR
jgi:hypothetical protein